MDLQILLLFCFLLPNVLAQGGTYTITAPNTIRPNSVYTIAINYVSQGSNNLSAIARISGRATTGNTFNSVENTTEVRPGTTQQIQLRIGNWGSGTYQLEVNGTRGVLFRRINDLTFNEKSFSLFIETDKSIYQLGQQVNLRVVAVNPNLLPYRNQPLSVYITDAQNNRIKQWNTRLSNNGMFENNLQLSDQPIKGQWSITATVRDVTATENFQVSEYVLPRFEVEVIPPSEFTTEDTQFVITLNAKYTFGGDVSGQYVVNVSESYCANSFSVCRSRPVVVTGEMSGTVQIPITVRDLNLPNNTYANLNVLAVVTEEFTGISRNDSATFIRYTSSQQLSSDYERVFKPQSPYTITLKLQKQNGLPVTNAREQVNLTYSFTVENVAQTETSVLLRFGTDGRATQNIVPPLYAASLNFRATYQKLTASGYASRSESLSDKYLTATVVSTNVSVGNPIRVGIQATFQMQDSVSYQIIGRGNILLARTISLSTPSNTTQFSFTLTQLMAPNLRIIVFYVSGCGEMVGDSLDVSVDGALRTPVTLSLSNTTLEPGETLRISISSRPSTLVALKSVDRSVLLMGPGNDITKDEVYNELQSYDIGTLQSYGPTFRFDAGIIRRPSYSDGFEALFQYTGIIMKTNGLYQKASTCMGIAYGGIRPMAVMKGLARPNVDMALEMAFDGAPAASGGGGNMVQPTRVRSFFPEVFIWRNVTTSASGTAELSLTVPDTITTWVINGIAMSNTFGLGVTDQPSNVTVFRPFFLVADLPFSVIRTEIVTIQVLIFNYLEVTLNPVIVTLNKTGNASEFDIMAPSAGSRPLSVQSFQANATVRPGDVQAVTFRIRPTTVGVIDLNFKAVSPYAGDAIVASLRVRAEGSPQYFAVSEFIDLRNTSRFNGNMSISIPNNAVPGSQYIEFSVIGDLMAPVIANLRNLIQLPSGCGEQNMINLMPNVVILRYLDRSNSGNPEMTSTALRYLEQGYQNELNYKRPDGSFSAFGTSDENGSTWLTAYVVKCFVLASRYTTIDANVILQAKRFLASKQRDTGEFFESGRVIHTAMQGGSGQGVGLTAFCLIAFLESEQNNSAFTTVINRGITYLESNFQSIASTYEVAIAAYALQLANSTRRDAALQQLNSRKTTEDGLSYWHQAVPRPSGNDWYYQVASTYDVEATSYALLTYTRRQDVSLNDNLAVIRWLISKRNALGSYSSSQDTVMAIQALAEVAPKISAPANSRAVITITYLGTSSEFTVNRGNALVLQKRQLPREVRSIRISATGNGVAIVQAAWNYNVVKNDSRNPSFRITAVVTNKTRSYSINVCAAYIANGTTNMALVEVASLSGYEFDISDIPEPGSIKGLKRVDRKESNTLIIFYFDSIPSSPNQLCISLTAFQKIVVDDLKEAMISVYDYYESSKRAEVFYSLRSSIVSSAKTVTGLAVNSSSVVAFNSSSSINIDGSASISIGSRGCAKPTN